MKGLAPVFSKRKSQGVQETRPATRSEHSYAPGIIQIRTKSGHIGCVGLPDICRAARPLLDPKDSLDGWPSIREKAIRHKVGNGSVTAARILG